MSLVRIGLAFLAVAALFEIVAWVAAGRQRGNAIAPAAEALVLTLLAALWFGSLGHGSWVLLFLLLGVLVSGIGLRAETGSGPGPFRVTAITTSRYVVAGGLFALIIG